VDPRGGGAPVEIARGVPRPRGAEEVQGQQTLAFGRPEGPVRNDPTPAPVAGRYRQAPGSPLLAVEHVLVPRSRKRIAERRQGLEPGDRFAIERAAPRADAGRPQSQPGGLEDHPEQVLRQMHDFRKGFAAAVRMIEDAPGPGRRPQSSHSYLGAPWRAAIGNIDGIGNSTQQAHPRKLGIRLVPPDHPRTYHCSHAGRIL
jgi:hypothetical protein